MKKFIVTAAAFFAVLSLSGQDKFTDQRDGNVYQTIQVEGKVWFSENLRYKPEEGFGYSENDPRNTPGYGVLYNWKAAVKACPDGWRLPTGKEYQDLIDHHDTPEFWVGSAKDKGSFRIKMAGLQDHEGTFSEREESAYLWTSTEYDGDHAEYFSYMVLTDNIVVDISRKEDISDVSGTEKSNKYSVRCVKDK